MPKDKIKPLTHGTPRTVDSIVHEMGIIRATEHDETVLQERRDRLLATEVTDPQNHNNFKLGLHWAILLGKYTKHAFSLRDGKFVTFVQKEETRNMQMVLSACGISSESLADGTRYSITVDPFQQDFPKKLAQALENRGHSEDAAHKRVWLSLAGNTRRTGTPPGIWRI